MPNQLLEHQTDHRSDTTAFAPAPPGRQPDARPRPLLRLLGSGLALVVLLALLGRVGDLLPSWDNPLEQKTIDRSTAPLMLALEDLTRYQAATGTFQVVIDREKDTRYVPSAISGERVSFLATGTVEAYVDFAGLGDDRVRVSDDRRTVSFSLPAAQLGQARVDPRQSRVLGRDRGVLDRIGSAFAENPSVEGELYAIGERRLAAAAAKSDLEDRAEANTRAMLTALARSLGYREVTVTFDAARCPPRQDRHPHRDRHPPRDRPPGLRRAPPGRGDRRRRGRCASAGSR